MNFTILSARLVRIARDSAGDSDTNLATVFENEIRSERAREDRCLLQAKEELAKFKHGNMTVQQTNQQTLTKHE